MALNTPTTSRSRRAALAVLSAGTMMIILDGSVVAVALPVIGADLHLAPADLSWVVNAYLITFGGLLLLSGRLGDLVGRRRVFTAGVVLFTAASLLCGLADRPVALIAARSLQGAGGALVSAVSLGIVATLFPEPSERAQAIGVFSFAQAAGGSIGVLLGGVLAQAAGWRWIFLVNVPLGMALTALASRRIARDEGLGLRAGADVAGAALVTAGLMLAVATIVGTGPQGWASARTLGSGVLSVLLLAGFVVRQATAATPLLPLHVFRARDLRGANAVMALMVAGLFGFQFLLALFLQGVLGWGAVATGLAYLPGPLAIAVISLGAAARLGHRLGYRTVLVAGLIVVAGGFALLARVPLDGRYLTDVLPAVTLLGIGAGLALPTVMTLGMVAAAPADAGVASGLLNTTQQVGGALGLAVLATLAAGRSARLAETGWDATQALAGGYHLAFAAAGLLLLAAAALATTLLPRDS